MINFNWPIQPPPSSTPGQLFGANAGKHTGLDMGTADDTVLAAAAGTVTVSTLTSDSRGRIIHIDHGLDEDGAQWETRYYHLAESYVSRGDVLAAGDTIAAAGQSGLPLPHPHLHFEVRKDGVAIDPRIVLGVAGGGGLFALMLTGALVFLAMK